MKLKSDRKNYVIMALCAILLVMSIGYAAFSSLLTINGTASLSDSFCVGFDNTKTNTYTPTAGITNGTLPTGSMSYSGTACSTKYQPNSSLSATFKQPGDKIEYTLTIANKSTFTVAIESLLVDNQNVTSNTTITKGNIKYIVEMPLTTTLASNAETTMKITAMFQNNTDVTGQYSGESQTINVKINAEQGDSGFTPTPSTFTGAIYRNNTTTASIGDSIVATSETKWCAESNEYGSSCADGIYFEDEIECDQYLTGYSMEGTCEQRLVTIGGVGEYTTDASTLNKTFYLKHDVVEDEIINSYVCFVYNNAEHCMKGGDGGASYSANQQILRDFQAFNNLPDNANPGCYWDSSSSYCYGGGFSFVSVASGGSVSVYGSSSEYCYVGHDGSSRCRE